MVDFGLGKNVDLRGQGQKANVSVKIMIDGKTLNMLDNAHGVTPLESIELENLERIEIIPGGGAVLYGNGTRGGVINIITKNKKNNSFSFALKSTGYENGNLGVFFNTQASKKISDSFSLQTSFSTFNQNGSQEDSNEKGFSFASKAFIEQNENQNLTFAYSYFENTHKDTGYLTRAQIQSNPYQKGSSDIIARTNTPVVNFDFLQMFGDNLQVNISSLYRRQNVFYKKNLSPVTMRGMTLNVDRGGSNFEDTLGELHIKSKYSYNSNSFFIFGYDANQHNARNISLLSYAIPNILSHRMTSSTNIKKQSHSLFVLGSHQFFENFFLSGGLRYEYAKYKSARSSLFDTGRANPSPVSFTMNPERHQNYAFEITPQVQYSNTGSLYAKFEHGFISPTPSQLVSRDSSGYFPSNIKSETYDTFEIGINDFLWDFYTLNANIFYTQSKDEIQNIMSSHFTGAAWRYYNIDKTRRYGAEFSLSQSFFYDTLLLKQNLNFIEAKITQGLNKGHKIPYVPKVKLSAGAEYTFSKELLAFINCTYSSRKKDGGIVQTNAQADPNSTKITQMEWMKEYFITDIGGVYTKNNLSIQAGIRNLFNKTIFQYQGYNIIENGGEKLYGVGQGRNYYVEFKYAF
ncbi:TonB-dependent receptor [Campylobacter sp. MIT 21-1685]|uniref:TonB-dependent receptor n=1 Tax=unclassified Campylobacter TaxID=2593542 RepID=UPI00224AC5A2|nr:MULTISPECIES: TonB-dependent receptor [unclassified Campylobacter]MCX2682688.1 TonB-dependent receptor [Campylobacter sp. MIT 21-1684]MCX2750968.1 TonB-dependent receptor [Campylobacter sp. MIT 21-1682]MCX2807099.1 TonB-dependent receptor [Campylobacter sp. MIT 21-1685]